MTQARLLATTAVLALVALGLALSVLQTCRAVAPRAAETRVPARVTERAASAARRAHPAEAMRPATPPKGRPALLPPLGRLAFMERYASDVCRCADRACSDEVNRYYGEHLGALTGANDDGGRVHEEERRALTCAARFAQSPAL